MVELFNRSLKCEHLYQSQIGQAAEHAKEDTACLALYNRVRPYEALGQRIPLAVQRGEHHLFGASSVQQS